MPKKPLHERSGISNPYALAERVSGKKVDWNKKSFESRVKILEKTLKMPYKELLNPKYNSPLYHAEYIPAILHEVSSHKTDTTPFPSGGQMLISLTIPSDSYPIPGGVFTVGNRDVQDPVQGPIGNCWLIATLASLAWCRTKLANTPTCSISLNQTAPPYKFKFTDIGTGTTKEISTNEKIPRDPTGNPVGCMSATANEIWPPLYEKAYYQWRDMVANNLTSPPEIPNYDDTGTSLQALRELTKLQTTSKTVMNTDPSTVFSDIYGSTETLPRIPIEQRKMKYPATAWTYDPDNLPSGFSVDYSGGPIAGRHDYSLLGTLGKLDSPLTDKYIVLRDPWGLSDPSGTGVKNNISWCGIDLSKNDAIFAYNADEFVKKFQGYGWTII